MKKILALFAVLAVVFLVANTCFAEGDTGTYRILSYKVAMTPHADGTVDIDYYQKWQVTSGHIPWITVGTANSEYRITKQGLAAKKCSNASDGSWQGVRIDLDRDYMPRAVFEVSFTVSQTKLFYADDKDYKMDFTPGWYDRAKVDAFEIRIKPMAPMEKVKTTPKPSSKTADELVWSKNNLGEGEKFDISISFPKNALAKPIPDKNLDSHLPWWVWLIIFIVAVVIIVLVIIALAQSGAFDDDDGYSGGGIFSGGGGGGGGGGRSSGGGGGFGGRSSSCACACVSCACACACAGGGGAGCSRKLHHKCRHCSGKEKASEDSTPHQPLSSS